MPPTVRRELAQRLIAQGIDWWPVVLICFFLIPKEAVVNLGGFQLYAYRVGLILLLPVILGRALKNGYRIQLTDFAMLMAGVWTALATLMIYGAEGIASAGSLALDFTAAYFTGRILIDSPLAMRRLLYMMAPVFLAVGVLLFLESVSHEYLLRPLLGKLTGSAFDTTLYNFNTIRLGLLRATGPFQHPIAGGLVMGSLLPLYIFADLPRRGFLGITASLGGLFCLSSAAIMSLVAGFSLSMYQIYKRLFGLTWKPVIATIVFGMALVQVGTESGVVKFIVRNLSLDPQTGYFRLLIWDYGWADTFRHPWFGIGYAADYVRPQWMLSNSVDNFWLAEPLRFGLPVLVFMSFGFLGNLFKILMRHHPDQRGAMHGRQMEAGLAITLVVVYVLMFTVAPWGAEISWFLFLIGAAGGITSRSMKK